MQAPARFHLQLLSWDALLLPVGLSHKDLLLGPLFSNCSFIDLRNAESGKGEGYGKVSLEVRDRNGMWLPAILCVSPHPSLPLPSTRQWGWRRLMVLTQLPGKCWSLAFCHVYEPLQWSEWEQPSPATSPASVYRPWGCSKSPLKPLWLWCHPCASLQIAISLRFSFLIVPSFNQNLSDQTPHVTDVRRPLSALQLGPSRDQDSLMLDAVQGGAAPVVRRLQSNETGRERERTRWAVKAQTRE